MSRLPIALVLVTLAAGAACDSAPDAQPAAAAAAPAADPAVAAATAPAATPAEEKTEEKAEEKTEAPAPGTDAIPSDDAEDECLYGAKDGECMPPPEAEGDGHFGAPFALTEARSLADAIASFDTLSGPVQVTGEVGQVCQKKGCWMVIRDGESEARVLMKDHAFAVPMDGEGAAATVEGELTKRTFTAAQVRHIAKDAGKEAPADAQDREEFVLTASGVALRRS